MAWLFAGAALAALALFSGAGALRIAAFLVLAGGAFLALRAYPPLPALALCTGGIAAGFLAARLTRRTVPRLPVLGVLLLGAVALLFASLGPAEGLF